MMYAFKNWLFSTNCCNVIQPVNERHNRQTKINIFLLANSSIISFSKTTIVHKQKLCVEKKSTSFSAKQAAIFHPPFPVTSSQWEIDQPAPISLLPIAGWLGTGTSRAVGTHAINHPSPEAPSLLRGPHPLGTGLTVWLGWRRRGAFRQNSSKVFTPTWPGRRKQNARPYVKIIAAKNILLTQYKKNRGKSSIIIYVRKCKKLTWLSAPKAACIFHTFHMAKSSK